MMDGVVASRDYSPTDVIYSEPAFAKVLRRQYKDALCEYCCKACITLKSCMQCSSVKYCGKNCQKNDWYSHKLECNHLKNLPKGSLTDFVRLVGKVILKIKGKDWKLIICNVLGKEFSFDDIDSHYKEFTENQRMILFFEEVKELTGRYIGFENLPDDESLIKIVGKVRFNEFRTHTRAFFIGASIFGLECIPNSNATVWGNKIKIWAFKKIRKEEDKITVPGRMIYLSTLRIGADDLISCKCTDCSLPFGESILFKIINRKKAFSVLLETEKFLQTNDTVNRMMMLPGCEKTADRLLQEQENVLGDTHAFRMALLAVRGLNMQQNMLQKKELLLKLERSMRSAFGEYYMEMLPIYRALCGTNLLLGSPLEAAAYAEKAMFMELYSTE